MGIREWLIPQEKIFFVLLQKESKLILKGVLLLSSLLKNYNRISQKRKNIKKIEEEVDGVAHEIYDRLTKTFITPIDHEDIARLTSFYDDVLDLADAVAARLYLYKIEKPDSVMKKFSQILLKQVRQIDDAIFYLPKMDQKEIEKHCTEVHRLENLADDLLDRSMAYLFKNNGDAREIIKLKEIYEFFEEATDKCEHVTNILRNAVMKNL